MSVDIATLGLAVDSTQVARAHGELDRLAAAGGRAEASANNFTRSIEAMLGPLRNIYASIGVVTGALAGWKLGQYAQEAAQLAARIETLDVVMKAVGNSSGYTEAQMKTATEAVRRMGITMQESRDTVTKMAQSQLDLTKSSQLARVAQDAAVIGNVNSSEALGRLIHGIRSAEVETLRTIGINVSWEQSYAKMAVSLGKSIDSLSEGEKAIARQNAVLDAGKNMAGAYAGAMDTAAKMLSSTSRFIEDSTANIGKAFLPAYTDAVRAYYGALKSVNDTLEGMSADGTLESIGKDIQGVASYADEAAVALLALGAGRYFAPLIEGAVGATARFAMLTQAVAAGNAMYIDGVGASAARTAASLEATRAIAAETNATFLAAQANMEFTRSELAVTRAELATAQAQKAAQINNIGRLAMQREIMALRQIEAVQLETLVAREAQLAAATTANAAAMRTAATATTANNAALAATTLSARLATGAMTALRSVMAFFGGPIGFAITALAAGIYVLATRQTAAEKAAEDHADALRRIKGEAEKAAPSIDKVTEALIRQQRARTQQKVDTAAENMSAIQGELGNTYGGDRVFFDAMRYGREAAIQVQEMRKALNEGRMSVEDFGDSIDQMAAKNPDMKDFAATIREQVDVWRAAREAYGDASTKLQGLTGANDAATAALARGRIASQGFEDALTNLLKASGLAVKDGKLMAQGLAEVAGYEATLGQVNEVLAGTFKVNGEAVNFTGEQMDRLRQIAPQLAEAFRRLKESQDPVTQSVKAMADQMRLLEVPAGVMRDKLKAVQDAEREAKRSLTPQERGSIEGQVDANAVASLRDHNRELEQRARLEKMVAAAAGGNAGAQAQATRTVELYNQALRTYGVDVAEAVLAGKKLPDDLQATARAMRDVDLAKFGGEAARSAVGLRMQADAQDGVARAALVSTDAMRRAEIHARAVDMAFRTGAGSVSAWEQALVKVYEAEQRTSQNEYVRQIQVQVAANDNLAAAYRDGSTAAIEVAERENDIKDVMDRLGLSYSEAARQVDELRRSRDGLTTDRQLDQYEKEIAALERLGQAHRQGEDAYRRQQALEEADRFIRESKISDPAEQGRVRGAYLGRSDAAAGYEAEARVLQDLHGRRSQAKADMEAINRLYQDGAISAEEFAVAQNRAMMDALESSRDFADGAELAMREYYDAVSNGAQQAYRFTRDVFQSMEDSIVKAVRTGKLSFTDLFNTIIEGLIRIQAQKMVLGPLSGFLDSFFSGIGKSLFGGDTVPGSEGAAQLHASSQTWADYGSSIQVESLAPLNHFGGMAGMGGMYRPVDPSIFLGAPRFHNGKAPWLYPGEVPAILKDDEEVLTRQDPRHRWNQRPSGGGGGLQVIINDNRSNSGSEPVKIQRRSGPDGSDILEVMIHDTVEAGMRKGRFDGAMTDTFGAQRQGTRRS